jgi:nucleolar protein 56
MLRATIIDCFMGVFGFGEDDRLVDVALFPKDATEIADRLSKIESGKIVDELAVLLDRLKSKDYTSFVFERDEIAGNVREELSLDVNVEKPSTAGELLRGDMVRYAKEVGFAKDEAEVGRWLHRVSMELTKLKVRKATEKRDMVVVQAIQAIDDLEKTVNLFMNRIREWYGLHFPELSRLVEKHETYARLVGNLGDRSSFTVEDLVKEGLPKSRAEKIADAAGRSMGAELLDSDLKQIREICERTLQLYDARYSLEKYTDGLMGEVAPNIEALAGPTLGARLVSLAGGLSNLAKMPSSTIQVLGAEKALFRSLRTGARPPKHGVIFQHRFVHDAKRWQRGRIARALAGKLAIAARSDAFSGKYIGDTLREGLEKRVEEIKEKKYKPKPKPARAKKPSKRRKRRKGAKRRGGKG